MGRTQKGRNSTHRSHPLTPKVMAIFMALALLALGGVVLLRKVGTRENGLPPGPPTIPLLGNLHMFPTEFAHYKYVDIR